MPFTCITGNISTEYELPVILSDDDEQGHVTVKEETHSSLCIVDAPS